MQKAQIRQVVAAETLAKEAKQVQVRKVTEANTLKKEAAIAKERKVIELDTAKLEAQRIETLAKAESRKRRLLMEADNALEIRLQAYVDSIKVLAKSIEGKDVVPKVVIGGGGGKKGQTMSSTDFISLLMAKAANDLGVSLNESIAAPGKK